MLNYILKRIGLMIVTFFIAIFLYFMFIKLIPDNHIPPLGSDDVHYQKVVEREGWDKPIPVQFLYWVRNIVIGNEEVDPITGETYIVRTFGWSKDYSEDVSHVYFRRLPATIKINIIPYLVSIPLAIMIGIAAALHKNKIIDHIISVGIVVFISVPTFVTFVLAQYLFYFKWGIAPSYQVATASEILLHGTWFGITTYIMPVVLLTIVSIPGSARTVRAELTEQLTQDYILLAQAKGLTRRQATYRHALKNALAPFLPGMIIGIVGIMSGSIIFEQIFGITGTGGVFLKAFQSRDYNMVMLGTVFTQFIGLAAAILSDISLTIFDPRVRVGSGKIAS